MLPLRVTLVPVKVRPVAFHINHKDVPAIFWRYARCNQRHSIQGLRTSGKLRLGVNPVGGAYCGWNRKSGRVRVMASRQKLQSVRKMVLVDEFRTSKRRNDCGMDVILGLLESRVPRHHRCQYLGQWLVATRGGRQLACPVQAPRFAPPRPPSLAS